MELGATPVVSDQQFAGSRNTIASTNAVLLNVYGYNCLLQGLYNWYSEDRPVSQIQDTEINITLLS